MTPRELFINALLKKEPVPGTRVPAFELVFFLTMELLGKVHPEHRKYSQWTQMKQSERDLHIADMAELYIKTAERFEHNAIFVHRAPGSYEGFAQVVNKIREISGDKYFILMHGDCTFGLPDGDSMLDFVYRLADEPEKVKAEAEDNLNEMLEAGAKLKKLTTLDGFGLCSDYALNAGPFLSPGQFSEFVAPYLKRLCDGYRSMGYLTIKHTDGNINPILDQIVQAGPDALHSIDPQGGMDIAKVKKEYGKKLCLIGNVDCGLMDTGTDEQVIASARYAIKHGMPGGGYIFSTSNCVYTGMDLKRYELIMNIWKNEANYSLKQG